MGTFPLTAYVSVQSLPRRCLSCQPKFEAHSELQSTHFVAAVSDQPGASTRSRHCRVEKLRRFAEAEATLRPLELEHRVMVPGLRTVPAPTTLRAVTQ